MTVDEAIARAFTHAQRKDTTPASGTSKYNVLLAFADSLQKMWSTEPKTEWDSLYDLVTVGTVTTATDYDLDDDIASLSKREDDKAIMTNGVSSTYFAIVAGNQIFKYRNENALAQLGRIVRLTRAIPADSTLIGYSLKLPVVIKVDDITVGTQTVQVDDPMWLVYSMAAEFCRTDPVKGNQYQLLLDMANQCMEKMKDNNSGQMEEVATPWQPAGESW